MVKVVVLCGGRGSRLSPLTDRIPKPLVTLNGKPLLFHLVDSYVKKGFREFIICTGYRADMIKEFFESSCLDANVEFSDSGETAGILERLYNARELMTEQVFVAYGDTLINLDLKAMLASHRNSEAKVTITTANVRSPFGLVGVDKDGWVTSFEEKPLQSFYVGHLIMESSLLMQIPSNLIHKADGDGLVGLFSWLSYNRFLRTMPYDGPQITFNTQQELNQAEQDIVTFFTQTEEVVGP